MNLITPFKQKSEPLRMIDMPHEMRVAIYDVMQAHGSMRNHHVQAALLADVERRLHEHYRPTFGEECALTIYNIRYTLGALLWCVKRIQFGAEHHEVFFMEADIINGLTYITPGT